MASGPVSALRAPAVSRGFAITLGTSIGIHVFVLGFYAWWSAKQPELLEIPDEPMKATIVRLGKPRDPKLLPRIDTAPKPKPVDSSKAVPIKDAPKEETKHDDDASDRMKNALERLKQQEEQDDAKQNALARIAERVGKADDEPEGQEDGDPRGDSPTPAQTNAYIAALARKVKEQYVVPSVIQPHECQTLTAVVGLRMNDDGTVTKVQVEKSSGNDLFDGAVITAVKQASPLPPPPPNMRKLVSNGFAFKFKCPK